MKRIWLGLFLILFAGCEVIGPERGEVIGTVRSSSIVLSNRTGAPVYYFVVGRATVTVILWAPYVSEENEIPSGRSVEIAVKDIPGGENETEVIAYWWHARQEGGELRAGEIQYIVLALKG